MTTDIFEREIKNIPFIDCIDKNVFSTEFITAPLIPDFTLFLLGVIGKEKLEELEEDSCKNGSSEYDSVLRLQQNEYAKQIIGKNLLNQYYINDIKETKIYKSLFEIDKVYHGFLKTISGTDSDTTGIDRYKESKTVAKSIIRNLKHFDIQSQQKIINFLKTDSSIKRSLIIGNKNFIITNEVSTIETIFRTYLLELFEKINNEIQPQSHEVEPITETETDKIRLLHATGIIDFLIEKYPNSNPNQIAKFFELLSGQPMIAKNNNALFTTDKTNVKYPMENLSLTKKNNIKMLMNGFGFIKE